MFTSAGIDNLELRLAVTRSEARALKKQECLGRRPDGSFLLFGTPNNPLILLTFGNGSVLANLNVPKIAFGHNVRLAGPEQVAKALRVLATNTSSTPRLNWQQAEVKKLHVTFTCEVQDFEACAGLTKAPRGTWMETEFYPNLYCNANEKNAPVIVYDKAKHIREARKELPNDVLLAMSDDQNALYRFEDRLNQSPYSELKKHGGWNGNYLLAEDLCGNAFPSALKYLAWMFERIVRMPELRLPALPKNPTARAYAAHNERATANENPARMRSRATGDHNAGRISTNVLNSELARAALLERRELAHSLHAALEQECRKFGANILGCVETTEPKHATRELRHTDRISSYAFRA